MAEMGGGGLERLMIGQSTETHMRTNKTSFITKFDKFYTPISL